MSSRFGTVQASSRLTGFETRHSPRSQARDPSRRSSTSSLHGRPRRLSPPPRHEVEEPVEQVGRVVRAGRGLGVVLHRERLQRAVGGPQLETLDHVVVEADVAHRGGAVRRLGRRVERGVDREPVVVRRDLDLAGRAVHHRLVDAAVAVDELVGAETERAAEQLVAEADAEVGDAALEHGLQRRDVGRGRVARGRWRRRRRRASTASTSAMVAVAGQHVHLDPPCGHQRRGHPLDAEVERRRR